MSSTHISLLPEELLVNIFEHLYGNKQQSNLINNATLVCKKWNQIISQTHSLMNKLQLNLHPRSFDDIADLKLTRDYRHVAWNNCNDFGAIQSKIFDETTNLDYLNTLEISHWEPDDTTELMVNFQNLSNCKFLICLILKNCVVYGGEKDDEIKRFEFKSLRKLQLIKTSSCILNFIKCKELESFHYDQPLHYMSDNSDSEAIAFLNELDTCDEICIKFHGWNFDDGFKLKFLWHKLKMICECDEYTIPNAAAISSMKSFLEKSTTDAECDLTFLKFNQVDSTHNQLWMMILNSCKRITSLTLRKTLKLPSNLAQLRELLEVRTLKIDAIILEDVDNFSNFSRKLRNVTNLELFSEGFHDINLPTYARSIYQPFFNQITELSLDLGAVEVNSWTYGNSHEKNQLISNILCENLTTIRIIDSHIVYSGCEFRLSDLFLRFCMRNQNLRRLEVLRNVRCFTVNQKLNLKNLAFIEWYNQLREIGSTIETCKLMVIQNNYKNQATYISWRDMGVGEIELFGRSLTDAEKRFFN